MKLINPRRGAVLPSTGKTRVTMYLDDDVIEHFREKATENGRGYQTEINSALRAAMGVEAVAPGVTITDFYTRFDSLAADVGEIRETLRLGDLKGLRVVVRDSSGKGGSRGFKIVKKAVKPAGAKRALPAGIDK